LIKSIKTSLLFELLDYCIKNNSSETLADKLYIQPYKDLKVFLECSDSTADIKRFLKKKELEK
jgi:hypothetical protein